jgi:hypothetical protein
MGFPRYCARLIVDRPALPGTEPGQGQVDAGNLGQGIKVLVCRLFHVCLPTASRRRLVFVSVVLHSRWSVTAGPTRPLRWPHACNYSNERPDCGVGNGLYLKSPSWLCRPAAKLPGERRWITLAEGGRPGSMVTMLSSGLKMARVLPHVKPFVSGGDPSGSFASMPEQLGRGKHSEASRAPGLLVASIYVTSPSSCRDADPIAT